MFGGLNRPIAATLLAFTALLALVAPSAAYAGCNGRPSAENVYSPCLPSGGGGKSASSGGHGGASSPSTHLSRKAAVALKHAGGDRRALAALIHSGHRVLPASGTAVDTSTPSALGSAFDLGAGPTALLLALAGTAVFLLGASGVRGWRRSHRA